MGHSGFGKHDPSDGNKSYEIDLCHGARCISWTPAAQRSHHFCFLGTSSCRYPGWQWSLATEVRRKRRRPVLDFIAKKNGLTMFDCSDRDPESTYELPFLWTFSLGTLCKRCKRWVYDFWLYNSFAILNPGPLWLELKMCCLARIHPSPKPAGAPTPR